MKTITELDSNFIPAPPDYPDAVFLDALSEPFRLYGRKITAARHNSGPACGMEVPRLSPHFQASQ